MARPVCLSILLLAFTLVAVGQQGDTPTTTPDSAVPSSASNQHESTKDSSSHNWHWRLGTIGVGAGYFHSSGLYVYGPYGYYPYYYSAALWDPFWNPYWGPSVYLPNLAYAQDKGEVRLSGVSKDAKVYLDGAFAGTADRLKHMWLDPGAYDLVVTIPGGDNFQQRIYVLSGKTLKIAANQAPSTPDKEKP